MNDIHIQSRRKGGRFLLPTLAMILGLAAAANPARGQEFIGQSINNGGGVQTSGPEVIFSSIGEPLAGDSLNAQPDETTWTGFWNLGAGETVSSVDETVVAGGAGETRIEAVRPTPFTHELTVALSLARAGDVLLALRDPLGREVGRLIDGRREGGFIDVTWRPEGLESGAYFLDLTVDGRRISSRQVQYYR